MLMGYVPLAAAVAIGAIIACAMVLGSWLLGPRRPNRTKADTYECGMRPVGTARERFPVRYYLIAMLFIIFDVETVFLYPWASSFGAGSRAEKLFLLGEMGVFVAILLIAYLYVLGTRAFDWGVGDSDASSAEDRTAPQTARRRPPIVLGNENSGPVRLTPRSGTGH